MSIISINPHASRVNNQISQIEVRLDEISKLMIADAQEKTLTDEYHAMRAFVSVRNDVKWIMEKLASFEYRLREAGL